ncbi:MAG TPA: alpha/beta hydrolase, partial [Pseudomonas sp.]|uniref:alpha/beta hydrolase n=1 Tax=Pseudomonas sp. TaxID=306 RepID=UPI002EDB4EC1
MKALPRAWPACLSRVGTIVLTLWTGVLAAQPTSLPAVSTFTQDIAITDTGYRAPGADAAQRSFANGVTRMANLHYASPSTDQSPLPLDLYLPATPAVRRPLIVYIHGGGWSGGDARTTGAFEDFPAVLARFAAQGYAVASVNYRLSGTAIFPAAQDDVHAAIGWLQDHASQYALDPQRLAVWGNSSGGHLAALTALGCDADTRSHPCPKVLIGWFGIYDMQRILADDDYPRIRDAARRFMGCTNTPCATATVKATSAAPRPGAEKTAVLLIHGTADPVVPYTQSVALADALKRQG